MKQIIIYLQTDFLFKNSLNLVQVKSEIKVTKTSTMVVEKKMVGLEKGKKEQDFLIDHLMA